MPYNYTAYFSRFAKSDLKQITDYITIELQNKRAATNLTKKIKKAIETIKQFPLRCPLLQIEELQERKYRKCLIDNYVLVYNVDEGKKNVIIMRIFYSPSDYPAQL
jgi:addiction module RelE/StbE family toxin